jgi:hypothetical protein
MGRYNYREGEGTGKGRKTFQRHDNQNISKDPDDDGGNSCEQINGEAQKIRDLYPWDILIRKCHIRRPKGTATIPAIETIVRVPKMACFMPPPISPTGTGSLVKKVPIQGAGTHDKDILENKKEGSQDYMMEQTTRIKVKR